MKIPFDTDVSSITQCLCALNTKKSWFSFPRCYSPTERPARAQELFEKMCQGQNNVFEEKKNPCMCNFLAKVVPARMDLMSLKGAEIPCVDGFASAGDESYPCHNVNLLSRVGLSELLSVHGNANFEEASDIWGWVGPNDEEIAIIGLMSGTSFVDVTDPLNPVFLGNLPAKGGRSTYWRDIKTYENFAYIVSENQDHGLQVRQCSGVYVAFCCVYTKRDCAWRFLLTLWSSLLQSR